MNPIESAKTVNIVDHNSVLTDSIEQFVITRLVNVLQLCSKHVLCTILTLLTLIFNTK